MKASDIDFSQLRYFSDGEFPNIRTDLGTYSVLNFLDASIIRQLNRFRDRLGKPVVPSPVAGAWIREGGSQGSQHYVGPIRLDDDGEPHSQRLGVAADFFPLCDIREAFMVALSMPEFGGIGVYLDTHRNGRAAPMMHLDLRTGTRQIWLRDGDGMLYPGRGDAEMKRFFKKLADY